MKSFNRVCRPVYWHRLGGGYNETGGNTGRTGIINSLCLAFFPPVCSIITEVKKKTTREVDLGLLLIVTTPLLHLGLFVSLFLPPMGDSSPSKYGPDAS